MKSKSWAIGLFAVLYVFWVSPIRSDLLVYYPGEKPSQIYAHLPILGGHSHNDYEQRHPLADAIAQHFYSVEADIWLSQKQILVSHLGVFFTGSLQSLYLDALQKRVDQWGSVYGDGKSFYLWIELKQANAELVERLHLLLRKYPMLSRYTQKGISPGPVAVILTGVESAKKLYVDKFPVRYATRDDDSFQVDDPPADLKWSWYALNWSEYLEWDGSSPISAEERERLQTLVRAIHRKGRHVRFYGAPDTKLAWEESKKADVDLIETDSLDAFNHYWSGI